LLLERDIQKQILNYCSHQKYIEVWRNNTTGIWDQKKGRYRLNRSKHARKGISDILGVTNTGRFLAIEVKSKYGKLTEHQNEFLQMVANMGGIAIVARSLEDVVTAFGSIF